MLATDPQGLQQTHTATQTRRVPELSLSSYTSGSTTDRKRFIDDFFTGLKDYGFIILKDHPVPEELSGRAYQLLEQLYQLPVEQKMRYFMGNGGQRGYTPFGTEHAKDSEVMDLKEFWHVGRDLPEGHKYEAVSPKNIWPEELPEFERVFKQIYRSLDDTGRIMLEALTVPLEVELDYFTQMTHSGNSVLRLLHYPPIPADSDPRCLRAAPHEDINLITILPSATASGLQLKDRDGSWLPTESNPNTLIVDAGDMLQRITNGLIPSTTHQVVNTPEGRTQSRYSMPFFMHPNPDAMLSCLPSCRGKGAQWPDITSQDFLFQRLREIGLI